MTLHKMADATQDEREATFEFIEEAHICPAVWNVLSVAYKDTKYKQKKMEELEDKVGFVQTFLFLRRFLIPLFSSSVLLFYCTKSAMLYNYYCICCIIIILTRVVFLRI